MAQKIVDDILAAEAEGKKIIASAEADARNIVSKAKEQAKELLDSSRAENASKLKNALETAQEANSEAAKKAQGETERLYADYSAKALKGKPMAVARVIELLRQP